MKSTARGSCAAQSESVDTSSLQDRNQIQDCLLRYVRGVDRRNWELVRSAYHVDAYDDHGDYKGGVDGLIDSLARRHATIEQSIHLVSNIRIEFGGPDTALLEAAFTTHQRLNPEAGDARLAYLQDMPIAADQAVQSEVIGRYIDLMTRREGVWRIAQRTVVIEVVRGHVTPRGGGLHGHWTVARRDGEDPVEVGRRQLGLRQEG